MSEDIVSKTNQRLDRFKQETGIWPPGRDMPAAYCGGEDKYQIRCRAYQIWLDKDALTAEVERQDAKLNDMWATLVDLETEKQALTEENQKLNLILYHRENGLAHPDLKDELALSNLTEEVERLRQGIINDKDNPVVLMPKKLDEAREAQIQTLKDALEKIALIGNEHVRQDYVCSCNMCMARLIIEQALKGGK